MTVTNVTDVTASLSDEDYEATLGALLEKNHPKFARLVQDSQNIAKDVKIDLLSQHVTLPSVRRWVRAGRLERRPDGRFDRAVIEARLKGESR